MSLQTTLGADLRALRRSRKMTLEDLSESLSVSVGWLSQVERDISSADRATLKRMAQLFEVPMSLFLDASQAPETERGIVVRSTDRREISVGQDGLIETLISPDLTDNFEVVHSTFLPGAERTDPVTRPTQELAYLVSGKLDIWIDEQRFVVNAGDSFRIRDQSQRWSNPYSDPAIAVWVISPPVY